MNLISTYFIIAGEQSADNHGALLMAAMLAQNPDIEFRGIGGRKMIKAGLNTLEDIEKMAVMGFVEVIRHHVGELPVFDREHIFFLYRLIQLLDH